MDLDSFVKAIQTSETPGQPEGYSNIFKAMQGMHMGLQKIMTRQMQVIVGKLDGQAQDIKKLAYQDMEVQQLYSDNVDLIDRCELPQGMVGRLTKEIKDLRQAPLDLKCMSMRDNLVFWGFGKGQMRNTHQSLRNSYENTWLSTWGSLKQLLRK